MEILNAVCGLAARGYVFKHGCTWTNTDLQSASVSLAFKSAGFQPAGNRYTPKHKDTEVNLITEIPKKLKLCASCTSVVKLKSGAVLAGISIATLFACLLK